MKKPQKCQNPEMARVNAALKISSTQRKSHNRIGA